MRASRFLRFSVVAFAVSALMVIVPAPGRATAAVPVPGIPSPVNVLPSTVSSGFTGAYEYAYLFAQYAMSNKLLTGAAKVAASATPTLTEAEALAAAALKFKIPATAIASNLVKGIGPAGLVISSAQLGLFLGNEGARIAGFKDDQVCMGGYHLPGTDISVDEGVLRSVAAVTNGVNCDAYDMTVEAQQEANDDAVAGLSFPALCDPVRCLHFESLQTTNFADYAWWCYTVTGEGLGPYEGVNVFKGGSNQSAGWANGRMCDDGSYALGAIAVTWFPPDSVKIATAAGNATGNPAVVTPTVSTGDPERRLVCTLRYSGGQTVSAQSAPYHESDGATSPIVCPDLPEGGTFEGWDIDLKTDGLTDQRLATNDALPSYTDFTENYAECMTGTCQLDLIKDGAGSCFQAPTECAGWLADPDRDITYSCRYGTHDVALSECYVYGPTFKPDAVTTGQTYGDPTTGATQSSPTTVPSDVSGFGQDVQDPDSARECFPTGWGVLNPVEWVTKPVQCALEWAFVPRASVLTATTTTMTASWDAGVGDKLGQIVAPFASIPVMTGCSGVPVDMDITWPVDWEVHWVFGYACDGPLQPLALAVRTVFSGLFVFMGLKLLSGYLGGIFGFRGFGNGGSAD